MRVRDRATALPDPLLFRVHHIAKVMERSWAAQQECIVVALWQYAAVRRTADEELGAALGKKGFRLVPIDVGTIQGGDVVSHLVASKTSDKDVCAVTNLRAGGQVALRSLNFRRELLVDNRILVLFWLDESELQSIASSAPDFWAFLHHLVDFTERPADRGAAEMVQAAHALQGDVSFGSAQELHNMIAVREHLLASLPQDYRVERLDLLTSLGFLSYHHGDWSQADRHLQQALKLTHKLRRKPERASLLHNLGVLAQARGDLQEARRLYEESLALKRVLGDTALGENRNIASTLHQLGNLAQARGDLPEANRLYQESLALKRELGDKQGIASTFHNLGMLAQDQGDLPEAHRLYQESLVLTRELGDKQGIAATLHQLGRLAQDRGDLPEAHRLYQESLALKRELGYKQGIATTLHQLGILAQDRGDLQETHRLYQESLVLTRELGDKQGIAATLHQLGRLAQDRGDLPEAHRLYQESLALKRELGYKQGIAISLAQLGVLQEQQGRLQEAEALLQQAATLFRELGSPTLQQAKEALARVQEALRQAAPSP